MKEQQNQAVGKQSMEFGTPVILSCSASIVGKKEGEGPLGQLFDQVGQEDMFGAKTWEEAESTLQKEAVALCLQKSGVKLKDVRYLFAGDLLGQSIASSFGLAQYETPLFGLYGACSTSGLSITLGAITVAAGLAEKVMCVTSSHFASAEKEFRYPLEYGNQRPLSASWTVTGGGAFLLSAKRGEKDRAQISAVTPGKIVDYGLKDSMNMGACMAPAACDTIYQHLQDFGRKPEDYDKIVTGDLGYVGQQALLNLLSQKGIELGNRHMDCGIEMFDQNTQDTHAGGSGCGCAATVLSAFLLKKLEEGEWSRILFVPTGALLSKVSFNEGNTVPGIAHGVVIERIPGAGKKD
ncbi:MAG: stage V sporulation protein AD [Lachnospiraceae bacterium]|nr:stage V sporulation protein AD [Lachnospiraceae bacterium]MDY3223089.1 stage V sporulation protein AD [Lachnospiraceae bacterium]